MDLKTIILNEEREKAATQTGWESWYQVSQHTDSIALKDVEILAHVRAIYRLDKVMRWASLNGWVASEDLHDKQWKKYPQIGIRIPKFITDRELLDLYNQSQSE